MTIKVAWDTVGERIILWTFEGFWTWDEVHGATEQTIAIRKAARMTENIALIFDLTNASAIRMKELKKAYEALTFNPEGRDMVVVVGRNVFVQTMVDILRQRYLDLADQFVSAETLNDARRLIRIHRTGKP